jgi:hypothetical protein
LDGKEAISQFKEWYQENYNVKPTEKLIETFCKMKGIKIEREEVAKVEEIQVCSVLSDVPVVTNDTSGAINPHIEENYKALETNYHNLLAEHQEICAIAQEQKQTIEDDNVLIVKLSTNMGKLLNIMYYYKDLLSPSDASKFEEIKREVV